MTQAHRPQIAGDPEAARALVLAGGGMRVAYQAGAVKALIDAGLRFAHADGASGGTINLAALMSGVDADDLCRRWRTLPVRRFASLRPLGEYLHPWRMRAFGDADGMVEHVYPALGVDLDRVRAAEGIAASFNVCRFDDKTVVPVAQRDLDLPRLVAAASLPIFMPALRSGGSTWTDAVWIKDANLLACVERGARELWLVWCIGNTPQWRDGAFEQYVHMIEMSAIGALNAELAAIADINARIARGETVHGHMRPIEVYLIAPELPLPLDPDFFFGRIDAATLIDMGYRDARRALRARTPVALAPEATRMRTPGLGVAFRETMRGGFSLRTTSPEEGARASDALSMHAAIRIDDIEAFVRDPGHRAGLVGHIDFAPFGDAIPAESGVFGLFSPSEDPRTVHMVYELGFRHEGEPYYLAGKKHVRIGAPWRLWRDTTTLYIHLHAGEDTSGPVVGAGVLRLGVRALLRLVSTFHATGAANGRERLRATWRFFGFFARELVRTYVLRRPQRSDA
jgi:predicted patatin/cPLA2 family phospholipase